MCMKTSIYLFVVQRLYLTFDINLIFVVCWFHSSLDLLFLLLFLLSKTSKCPTKWRPIFLFILTKLTINEMLYSNNDRNIRKKVFFYLFAGIAILYGELLHKILFEKKNFHIFSCILFQLLSHCCFYFGSVSHRPIRYAFYGPNALSSSK